MKLKVTKKQLEYIRCPAAEVLFGGSAGGGKSYALMTDALLYALRYPKSRQLVLRRTLPELDKSLVRTARELYPADLFRYNSSRHSGVFINGSTIDFGYCDSPGDMYRYQSAEYDVLRFDELTHFTEETYLYLISRLRGANRYPKQVKSCTNPGGIGHSWVKRRFIDPAPRGRLFFGEDGRLAEPDLVELGMVDEVGSVVKGGSLVEDGSAKVEDGSIKVEDGSVKVKGGSPVKGNSVAKESPIALESSAACKDGGMDSWELDLSPDRAGRGMYFKDEVYGELADPLACGILGSQPGRVLEGTRVFLPSRVQENPFIMKNDPAYLRRLGLLPDKERRALLYGEWDLFEGQYFTEFSRRMHVVEPRTPHTDSRIYRAMDYGLDMLACYWIALEPDGRALVMRELYRPGLIISEAAAAILDMEKQDRENGIPPVFMSLAPPDLWNRRQETGRSVADIFAEQGIQLTQSGGSRISGWMAVKEWLKPEADRFVPEPSPGGDWAAEGGNPRQIDGTQGAGGIHSGEGAQGVNVCRNADGDIQDGEIRHRVDKCRPKMVIFNNCVNLIRSLPALLHDQKVPNDAAKHPHEITHAPDALRCFCVYWTQPEKPESKSRSHWTRDMWEDYDRAGAEHRRIMEQMWGTGKAG